MLGSLSLVVGSAAAFVVFSGTVRRSLQSERELDVDATNEQLRAIERRIEREKNAESRQALLEQEAYLREEFERKYASSFLTLTGETKDDWREAILMSRDRLLEESKRLTARSSSTLAYGITTALMGILVLLFIVFLFPPDSEIASTADFLVQYGPRITVVIIVEFLAAFFLRMYARNERDILLNKNEITNLELRLAAGLMQVTHGASLSDIAKVLASDERNFVLRKGESSIPIDQNKALETLSELAEKLADKVVKRGGD